MKRKIQNSNDLQKIDMSIYETNKLLKGKIIQYKSGCYKEPTMVKVTKVLNISKISRNLQWKDRYYIEGIMVGSSSSNKEKPLNKIKINENYHCNIINFDIVPNKEFNTFKEKAIKSL